MAPEARTRAPGDARGPANPAPPGRPECERCAQPLQPSWAFCPACALPVRAGDAVLSSQIDDLRPAAPAAPEAAPGSGLSSLARHFATGAAVIVGTAAVAAGVVVFSPSLLESLVPAEPPAAPSPADPGAGKRDPLAIDWVLVPAGRFGYGRPTGDDPFTAEAELPAFEISRTEITNEQYRRFLEECRADLEARGLWRQAVPTVWDWDPPPLPGHPPDPARSRPVIPSSWPVGLPVRGVPFDMAAEFCAWLDKSLLAPGARLPLVYEWEKAARGTDGRRYPWGSEWKVITRRHGEAIETAAAVVFEPGPVPVHFTATDISFYGVLHMGGNVSEWTDIPAQDPDEPGPRSSYRIVRGASFQDNRESGEMNARTWIVDVQMERTIASASVGFRVARDAKDASAAGGSR